MKMPCTFWGLAPRNMGSVGIIPIMRGKLGENGGEIAYFAYYFLFLYHNLYHKILTISGR